MADRPRTLKKVHDVPYRPKFSEEVEQLLWSDGVATMRLVKSASASGAVDDGATPYLRFFTNKALET
jgi:hypothetical protein